jgi:hypothetical protein
MKNEDKDKKVYCAVCNKYVEVRIKYSNLKRQKIKKVYCVECGNLIDVELE